MLDRTYKLALIGACGAGKSTCIASVSDIPVISTEVPLDSTAAPFSDQQPAGKVTMTAAFDYGEMAVGQEGRLLLYGLPGQQDFAFMFDIVQNGLMGVIAVVDAEARTPIQDLLATLCLHKEILSRTPLVVVINKVYPGRGSLVPGVLDAVERAGMVAPVVTADLRDRSSVATVFQLIVTIAEHRHG